MFVELFDNLKGYFFNVAEGFEYKYLYATILTFVVNVFHIPEVVATMWIVMMSLRLIISFVFKYRFCLETDENTYAKRHYMLFTNMVVAYMVMLIDESMNLLLGTDVPLTEVVIFLLAITDAASILNMAHRMGLPVNQTLLKFVNNVKSRTENSLDAISKGEGNGKF